MVCALTVNVVDICALRSFAMLRMTKGVFCSNNKFGRLIDNSERKICDTPANRLKPTL